jgi:hypothetical protein
VDEPENQLIKLGKRSAAAAVVERKWITSARHCLIRILCRSVTAPPTATCYIVYTLPGTLGANKQNNKQERTRKKRERGSTIFSLEQHVALDCWPCFRHRFKQPIKCSLHHSSSTQCTHSIHNTASLFYIAKLLKSAWFESNRLSVKHWTFILRLVAVYSTHMKFWSPVYPLRHIKECKVLHMSDAGF